MPDDDRIKRIEARCDLLEERAAYAASVALAGIETTKHFMKTIEAQHEAMGEVVAATKKLVAQTEQLARHVLTIEDAPETATQ